MTFFGKCETPLCGRWGFFIRRRTYRTLAAGKIRSQRRTCGRCHGRVRRMIK